MARCHRPDIWAAHFHALRQISYLIVLRQRREILYDRVVFDEILFGGRMRRTQFLQVRATARELQAWREAADANDLKLSEFVRLVLRRESAALLSDASGVLRRSRDERAAS